MNFGNSMIGVGVGVGGINLAEIFERYPIIEEKSVQIMTLHKMEERMNNEVINPLMSQLREVIPDFLVNDLIDEKKFVEAFKDKIKIKIAIGAIEMTLKRGNITFIKALEKVEFSEAEVEGMLQEVYAQISVCIDVMNQVTESTIPPFYN